MIVDPRPREPDVEEERTRSIVAERLFGIPAAVPRIGRFAVIERVGRGAMGDVYAAYDPQLDRRVALKLLRAEASDQSMLAEARTMASINHPNVAQIYEIGSVEDRIFIAMEFVAGPTLRTWGQAAARHWPEVLAMYRQAAAGLAAAHAVGIVHRDFKPENALIGTDGRVRVVDFGLARSEARERATVPPDGDDPDPQCDVATVSAAVAGTPAYMAPEQSRGQPVDARSDQFSFCVALHEALHGARPFRGSTSAQLLHAIEERGIDRATVDPAVPARIVAVVSRGLSCRPDDRHPSMHALLAELDRDPSRRRRWTIALLAALALGAGTVGWQRARRAAAIASCIDDAAEIAGIWNDERRAAVALVVTAPATDHAQQTWERVQPRLDAWAQAWSATRTGLCHDETVEHAIAPERAHDARGCLDEQLAQFSALVDRLSEADATILSRAVPSVATLPASDRCRDDRTLARRMRPPDDLATRDAVHEVRRELARAEAGRATADLANALRTAQDALGHAEALGWSPVVAEARQTVGAVLRDLGHFDEARAMLEQAFYAAGAAGHDHVAMSAANALIQTVGVRLSDHADGLQWAALARMHLARLELGADPPDRINLLQNVAAVHLSMGAYDDAQVELEQALEISERTLGDDHPGIANILTNLGVLAQARGSYDDALATFWRAHARTAASLGPEHPEVGLLLNNIGAVQRLRGALAEALAAHENALHLRTRTLGPTHVDVAASLVNIGFVQLDRAAFVEALDAFERALAILRATIGPQHRHVATALIGLSSAHRSLGSLEPALAAAELALTTAEQALGPEHVDVGEAATALAIVLEMRGDHAAAVAAQERALAIWSATLGRDHPFVARAHSNLGAMRRSLGQLGAALVDHRVALEIRERRLGPDHLDVAASLTNMANVHADLGDGELALAAYERALQIFVRAVGPDHPNVALVREGIAAVRAGVEPGAARSPSR